MRRYKISIHATTLIVGIGTIHGGRVQISLFAPAIDGLLKKGIVVSGVQGAEKKCRYSPDN